MSLFSATRPCALRRGHGRSTQGTFGRGGVPNWLATPPKMNIVRSARRRPARSTAGIGDLTAPDSRQRPLRTRSHGGAAGPSGPRSTVARRALPFSCDRSHPACGLPPVDLSRVRGFGATGATSRSCVVMLDAGRGDRFAEIRGRRGRAGMKTPRAASGTSTDGSGPAGPRRQQSPTPHSRHDSGLDVTRPKKPASRQVSGTQRTVAVLRTPDARSPRHLAGSASFGPRCVA